jgi:hypothetical protein
VIVGAHGRVGKSCAAVVRCECMGGFVRVLLSRCVGAFVLWWRWCKTLRLCGGGGTGRGDNNATEKGRGECQGDTHDSVWWRSLPQRIVPTKARVRALLAKRMTHLRSGHIG